MLPRPALLVLVRHGQSQRNIAKRRNRFFLDDEARRPTSGIPDHLIGLTELGHRQARETGVALHERFGAFDQIYHSGYRRAVETTELRRAVAIVTQRPVLFSVPLRDNLLAARPDAPWDEVLAAAEAAGVAAFVDDLPDGYGTLVGERGVNLSGGQRQRVALARALLAGARVLVLDDPMSAVDTQTEHHLVRNLRPAVAGRTVLVATQRLSTLSVADRAVVVDDGRIVEQGEPAELLTAGGPFTALFGDESVAA